VPQAQPCGLCYVQCSPSHVSLQNRSEWKSAYFVVTKMCGIILSLIVFSCSLWSGNAEVEGVITPRPFFLPSKTTRGGLYGEDTISLYLSVHLCAVT
jgi:hypothetical protein